MKAFPRNLIPILAQNVDSRDTLAALCRVSKTYRDFCLPLLYREIWLDRCNFSTLEKISMLPGNVLKHTERLRIGRELHVDRGLGLEEVVEVMKVVLEKVVNLKSIRLEGIVMRDFTDNPTWDTDDSDDDGPLAEGEERQRDTPLQRLFQLRSISEIVLIDLELSGSMHPFQNLTKLALHNLERDSWEADVDDIARILIASPGLKTLGLSLIVDGDGFRNDMLRRLIDYYHKHRAESPLLRLSELHLGLGFLPAVPGGYFPEDDYLSQLTDLSSLKRLRLDNSGYNSTTWIIPRYEIHTSLFTKATHVEKISVERFSSDIVELVENLKKGALKEIEISRYFETLKSAVDIEDEEMCIFDEAENGKRLFSQPLEEAGFHWEKVTYGIEDSQLAGNPIEKFVALCDGLEEVSVPMCREDLDFFKVSVMSKRDSKLHTLMIPRGSIAGLADHASELIVQHEAQRLNLAKEIFEHNRCLIREDSSIAPLRYFGIGRHVYHCLLATPDSTSAMMFSVEYEGSEGSSSSPERLQVVKLSTNESRQFDAVRRLESDMDF